MPSPLPFNPLPRLPRLLGWGTLALLLTACGDDSSTSPAPAATLSGTAAVGAAVTGATVNARCSSGATFTTTTRSSGRYGLVVPSAAFPCAVQLTGGNLPAGTAALHSFAPAPGNTNITPLTDLALALQVNSTAGQSLATWFATPSNWTAISTALGGAVDDLRDALVAAGYTLPAAWTAGSTAPFTGSFTPDPATDAMDQLLEALAAAISDPGSAFADYDALLASFVGGTPLPDAPLTDLPDPAGTGAALAAAEGITGTLNGTTFTYTTNVVATASTSPANPVGNLSAGTDSNNQWTLTGIPATVGTYDCKSIGDQPFIRLTAAGVQKGTHAEGGACRIQVTSVTADSIEGRFTARLINAGEVDGTVVDGYFRKSAPSGGGGGCSGDTLTAFNAVGGPYQLFATYAGSGTPDTTFTARSIYGVMVDGDCSIAVTTNAGTSMYTLTGAEQSIYNNSEGTGISLTYADGSQVFFTYDHAAKFASVFTYQDSVPLWGLRGPDTNRCPAQANTIATPLTMGAGPYVIAYADAGSSGLGHIGIDHRVDVTATFSENQGLFGYRASALEDWNHGCAKNHNSVGDSIIRIGKWRHGKTSLGYYSGLGINFTQYDGFHYAIAQAVTNKPASGSKSYTMPAGWLSEISSNALTLGGTLTCGGAGGACVTVNFATNTADIHITVTPAATPGTPLSFIQSGAEIFVEQGMLFVNGPDSTVLRLVLAGPNADHIVGSFVKGSQTGGSFGLRVPTI